MNAKFKFKIAIVIPVYNSAECVAPLCRALTHELDRCGESYQIIMVNDGSVDESWQNIKSVASADKRVHGICLRKNFGQDNAIMAGLNAASGEVVVVMDDDLQHSPQDIIRMVDKIEKGADVCYAKFAVKKHFWWKNGGSWFNGKVAEWVLGKPPGIYLSPFKALSGDVAEQVARSTSIYPYIDGIIFQMTSNICQIEAAHQNRYAGKSNYTLYKSFQVWLRLLTGSSTVPLRLVVRLGVMVSACSFLLALYYIILYLSEVASPPGWATLAVLMLFLGGVQMISLGVIGEYVGRAYLQVSSNPQYVVLETVNIQ